MVQMYDSNLTASFWDLLWAGDVLQAINLVRSSLGNIWNDWEPDSGLTPLSILVDAGMPAVQNWISNPEVSINATNRDGTTGLYAAILRGDTAIVRLLVDNGADVGADKPEVYTNAVHEACRIGNSTILQVLLRGENRQFVDTTDYLRNTPLMIAAARSHVSCCRTLLEAGASRKSAALPCAARESEAEVVRLLIEYGCSVDVKDDFGKSANDYALVRSDSEGSSIRRLLTLS